MKTVIDVHVCGPDVVAYADGKRNPPRDKGWRIPQKEYDRLRRRKLWLTRTHRARVQKFATGWTLTIK